MVIARNECSVGGLHHEETKEYQLQTRSFRDPIMFGRSQRDNVRTLAKNRTISPAPPSRQGRLFPPCCGNSVISLSGAKRTSTKILCDHLGKRSILTRPADGNGIGLHKANDQVKSCLFNSKSRHAISEPTTERLAPNAVTQWV